jgi:hypothetical protein
VSGDGGERGEVFALGGRWNEKKKNKIDWLAVDRVEMDRPVQPREHAEKAVEPFDTSIRERETIAQSGGSQLLAGPQSVADRLRVEVRQGGRARSDILELLLVVARTAGVNHPARFDKIGEIHGCTFARIFS